MLRYKSGAISCLIGMVLMLDFVAENCVQNPIKALGDFSAGHLSRNANLELGITVIAVLKGGKIHCIDLTSKTADMHKRDL